MDEHPDTQVAPSTAVAAGEGFAPSADASGAVPRAGRASAVDVEERPPGAPSGPAQGRIAASSADAAAGGTPVGLRADLERIVAPERVLSRPVDLVMYASDASFYRLIPQAVVLADGVE